MQETQTGRREHRRQSAHRAVEASLIAAGLIAASLSAAGAVALVGDAVAAPARPPLRLSKTIATQPAHRSGGVGMVLDGRAGRIVVARLVPGGPAAQAGVRVGDVVLSVNGAVVPAGAAVSTVAGMVRGPVGAVAILRVRRAGVASSVSVRRADLSLLFPRRASKVLIVKRGLALIATSGRWSLGVTFPKGGAQGDLLTYQWAVAPAGRKLSDAEAQRGLGAVAWGPGGATVQVADWRLDLQPWPAHNRLIVAGSNLPLATVDAAQWVETDPATARYVRPRPAPKSYRITWPAGPCTLRLHTQLDGQDAADHRVTLRLRDATGATRPSATVRTTGGGEATLRLPAGRWTIEGLHPSLSGGGHDLFYGATLPTSAAIQCGAGQIVDVALTAKRPAPAQISDARPLPAVAFSHPLVGKPLPSVLIKRWLGGAGSLPKTLKGHVLLVYFWATWCGPCKRVSPMIAELHARLAPRGLIVVPTSVDRDRLALQDYVDAELDGAAPVAWVGPTPLAKLPIRGIPTVVAIDDEGIVRAVHTGTGVGVETWTAWLGERLDEAQGKRPRERVRRQPPPVPRPRGARPVITRRRAPAKALRATRRRGLKGRRHGKKSKNRHKKSKNRHKKTRKHRKKSPRHGEAKRRTAKMPAAAWVTPRRQRRARTLASVQSAPRVQTLRETAESRRSASR